MHIFQELHQKELYDFKRLIKKVLLFTTPLMLLFLLNYSVDPFNINRLVSLSLDKKTIACYFNERLWKLNTIVHNPQKYIILGDSRSARFSEEKLYKISGKNFVNLSLSGATLPEIIDTFWFVISNYIPQEVVFCINFDRFNDWQKANGVDQAIATLNNPLMNYIQPETCKAVAALLMQHFFSTKMVSQAPPMSCDDFWNYQLEEIDLGYQRYVFPLYASRQLSSIANYCKQHAIKLSFIIFPTHIDLQERIDHAHLREQERSFKNFLASLATIYDFDVADDFTKNRNNFDDPKHVSYHAIDYIVDKVWAKENHNIIYT